MSASPAAAAAPVIDRDEWLRLARLAKVLSWASLVLIGAEGAIGIGAGIAAGSIALIGFGLDSVVEGLASLVIVWRFSGSRLTSATSELRAQRLVAGQFFLLAPYIMVEASRDLLSDHRADVSITGICLAVASLISMPLLGRAKQRIGRRMGSVATQGEGAQNILCAYMAAALLVGLVANALFGLWWLDPVAGLVIAALAIREGIDAWRGESCCIPSPTAASGEVDGCCSTH